MSIIIAIDLGGTQLRVAAFSPQSSTPLRVIRTSTPTLRDEIFLEISKAIDTLKTEGELLGICAACPGPTDPARGIILSAPNIPGLENYPLGTLLQERYGVPASVQNDANMAAVGEWRYGAGRGHKDLLYLTISTGIGGGVICNNQLIIGAHGLAAEFGHITVLPDGPLCSCGQRGHLEAISSGTAIARYVTEQIAAGRPSSLAEETNITARDVAMAARQGDALAKEAYDRAARFLAQGMADFLHLFNPSIVILGGGVSQSRELFFEPMQQLLQKLVMSSAYLKELQIVPAELGDDAGLLGAFVHVSLQQTVLGDLANSHL
ncbi:MAG: ROK family protein [Anaerolineales bacterium]|nr:ROK family protein [Anaerolineales bacterium]MCX7609406.1 ROK family protein [Anaerolineales bacterium]MDW8227896.1 ROK family protein [Anaerolineales bacterium]